MTFVVGTSYSMGALLRSVQRHTEAIIERKLLTSKISMDRSINLRKSYLGSKYKRKNQPEATKAGYDGKIKLWKFLV